MYPLQPAKRYLGVGILLLLLFRQKLEFPRIWIPLALFFFWTALADVVSPDPWGGRAQIKKFFIFFFIPLMYGVFARQFAKVFHVMVAWTVAATASGIWGLVQFVMKYQQEKLAPEGFYVAYLRARITGFESHWMTFGALQLSVLSLLLANWFFSSRKMPAWAYGSIAILSAAILLGQTRSIWLATIPSVLYLVWFWRPKMILVLPVLAVIAFLIAPSITRQRLISLVHPREDVDSNRHRLVTFFTGLEMIKAPSVVRPGTGRDRPQLRCIRPCGYQAAASGRAITAIYTISTCNMPPSAAFRDCCSSCGLSA